MIDPSLRRIGVLRGVGVLVVAVGLLARLAWPQLFAGAPAHAPASPAAPAAPAPAGSGAAPAVDAGIGFRSPDRLAEHFEKHGREFGATSAADYLARAQALRDRPPGGDVLEMVRADGVTCRFDRASGAFLAFNRDRTIRTFFRPADGEAYFRRQASRPADAP